MSAGRVFGQDVPELGDEAKRFAVAALPDVAAEDKPGRTGFHRLPCLSERRQRSLAGQSRSHIGDPKACPGRRGWRPVPAGGTGAQQCLYRRPKCICQPTKACHRHDGRMRLDMGEIRLRKARPDLELRAAPAEVMPTGRDTLAQVTWTRCAVAAHLPTPSACPGVCLVRKNLSAKAVPGPG